MKSPASYKILGPKAKVRPLPWHAEGKGGVGPPKAVPVVVALQTARPKEEDRAPDTAAVE